MSFFSSLIPRLFGGRSASDSARFSLGGRSRDSLASVEVCYLTASDGMLGSAERSLDIYQTAAAIPRGVVFFLHGGGLSSGHKRHVGSKPIFFNRAGYHFVSAGYPLASADSGVTVEHQLAALAALSTWITDQLGAYCPLLEGSEIIALGHSAGSYLLSLGIARAILPPEIRKCILLDSASYDLVARYQKARPPVRDEIRRLINVKPANQQGLLMKLEEYSPAHIIRARQRIQHSPGLGLDVLLCTTIKPGSVRSAAALGSSLRLLPGCSATQKAYQLEHTALNRAVGMANQPISHDVLSFLG